jgi:multidrug resistance protein
MGFGVLIPVQPFLAESFGAVPTVVTLLGASYSLMQFIFAPFWGSLSDKIGRRPVLLISTLLAALGHIAFVLSGSLPLLFFARCLSGIGSANIPAAQAIIADVTEKENRAKGMGLIGAAFGLGFIFGPLLGGVLGTFGLKAPAYGSAVLCLINFIFICFWLPETNKNRQEGSKPFWVLSLKNFRELKNYPGVGALFFVFFLYIFSFSMMEQVIGLFVEHVWLLGKPNYSATESVHMTSLVLICVGITATIVQGGLIGGLVKRFGERKLSLCGTLIVSFALFLLTVAGRIGSFPLFLMVVCGLAFGTGLINPTLSSMLSKSVPADIQGRALGIGQSLAALGRVFGPALTGRIFE